MSNAEPGRAIVDTAGTTVAPSDVAWRSLAEHAGDLIVRVDPSWTITYASPAARSVLGYAPEELVGRSGPELMHPDEQGRVDEISARVDAAASGSIETGRVRRADGRYEWVETMFTAIRDRAGVVVERQGSIRSIDDRRRADAARRVSLARYRTLAAHLPGGAVFLFDRNLRYLLAEGPALPLLGGEAELVGRTPIEGFPAPMGAEIARWYRQALDGRTLSWRAQASPRTFDVIIAPVRDRDVLVGGLAVAFDVTERAELEAEQQALLDVARVVAESTSLAEVLDTMVSRVAGLFSAVVAAVVRLDGEGGGTVLACAPATVRPVVPNGHVTLAPATAICRAAATRRPAVLPDYGETDDPLTRSLQAAGAVGGMAAPIVIGGRPWGVLGVRQPRAGSSHGGHGHAPRPLRRARRRGDRPCRRP